MVRGVYRRRDGREWGGFWYDRLVDERLGRCELEVRVPSGLREQVRDGQVVVARGVLQANCSAAGFRVLLDLTGVEGMAPPGATEAEQKRLELIRRKLALGRKDVYGLLRERLLEGRRPRVILLTGADSIVDRDVMSALGAAVSSYELRWERASMASAALLAEAIKALGQESPDLLAVVRGGGSGLGVFDDPEVARAVLECGCPVVSAVGHAADFCLMDDVADMRMETPTRLGQWLKELAETVSRERAGSFVVLEEEMRRLREEREALRAEIRDRVMRAALLAGAVGAAAGFVLGRLI